MKYQSTSDMAKTIEWVIKPISHYEFNIGKSNNKTIRHRPKKYPKSERR